MRDLGGAVGLEDNARPSPIRGLFSTGRRGGYGRVREMRASGRLLRSGDRVDEAIVDRFGRVEIAPAPHVLGDLLGGAAVALGQTTVEFPEPLLLVAVLRGDRFRGAGESDCGLGEVESRVRRSGAMIGGCDHADDRAANLTPAKDAQCRTQRVGRIDQDEGRLERAVRAV